MNKLQLVSEQAEVTFWPFNYQHSFISNKNKNRNFQKAIPKGQALPLSLCPGPCWIREEWVHSTVACLLGTQRMLGDFAPFLPSHQCRGGLTPVGEER